ncbi:AMP-dependent synthetase/ligase [Streptomyces sp. NPDC096132]|uniref:AMP-dependent synthetase/ligase n=1 Tax=Streptomyces sp. NPDC096132 TaxID=3366075 RepID=UPI00381512F7
MTVPSSASRTLTDLLTNSQDPPSLSWFADDLSPAPEWDAPPADSSGWCVLDGEAVREHVRTLAAGLIAAGVAPGERVALMMANRPEHWLTDQAVLHAGAIPSTFYPTLAPEQVRAQAAHARITTVVIEGPAERRQWEIALTAPDVRRVVVLDPDSPAAPAGTRQQSYAETLAAGRALLERQPDAVTERATRVTPDDIAAIIFTSGTTNTPKAVPLTHRNLSTVASGFATTEHSPRPYRTISYLPLAHIVDRQTSVYIPLVAGGIISFSPRQDALSRVIARSHPTVFQSMPRIWEKILGELDQAAAAAHRTGATPLHTVGLDELKVAFAGGAPLPPDVAARLHAYGLPLVDVYGSTEAAGAITSSSAAEFEPGTVGRAMPGVELRVAGDGELLVRGPQVTPGYLQPDGTLLPVMDADGWLGTGDLADIDARGNVRITGRKKEVIITSGGKNVSPVAVESLLTLSPLIAQALAHGSGRPYVVALLALDPTLTRTWLREQHGLDADDLSDTALAAHPAVHAEVSRAVEYANSKLSRAEQVKRWELLPQPWSTDDGTLTATLKLRRSAIETRHRDTLDGLYQAHAHPAGNGSGKQAEDDTYRERP